MVRIPPRRNGKILPVSFRMETLRESMHIEYVSLPDLALQITFSLRGNYPRLSNNTSVTCQTWRLCTKHLLNLPHLNLRLLTNVHIREFAEIAHESQCTGIAGKQLPKLLPEDHIHSSCEIFSLFYGQVLHFFIHYIRPLSTNSSNKKMKQSITWGGGGTAPESLSVELVILR